MDDVFYSAAISLILFFLLYLIVPRKKRDCERCEECVRLLQELENRTTFLDAAQTDTGEHLTRIDIVGDFTSLAEALESIKIRGVSDG